MYILSQNYHSVYNGGQYWYGWHHTCISVSRISDIDLSRCIGDYQCVLVPIHGPIIIPTIPTTTEVSSAEAAMGRDPATVAEVVDEPAPSQSEDMMPTSEISDNMKARLRRELESQGANPNKSAGNPILVVAAVVGLLVIFGGKGEMTYSARQQPFLGVYD